MKIYKKILWRVDLSKTLEESFYPSVLKKIKKFEPELKKLYNYEFIDVDEKIFLKMIFPKYKELIGSRSDFRLDIEDQKAKMLNKIKSGRRYQALYFNCKKTGCFVGFALFSLRNNYGSYVYRVFDRNLATHPKKNISADNWAEKLIFEYFKKLGFLYYNHGLDTHPYTNNLGLGVYKMKFGCKPTIQKTKETMIYEVEECEIFHAFDYNHILFFSNPNKENRLTTANLYLNKEKVLLPIFDEANKILEWSGLEVNLKKL